jgi:hypothetical protein
LPSANGVRDLIVAILNNDDINLNQEISNNLSFCNFKGKVLSWHSPVAVGITDSTGRHTGPLENGVIEYGIEGVDYDVIGHNKFIFLPTDDGEEYSIEAVGLEKGTFDLNISEVDNGQYVDTKVFNDVPVDTSTLARFEITGFSADDYVVLENGLESKKVTPIAILDGDIPLDFIPPETQVMFDGKIYKGGEFKKETTVTFSATDDITGVFATYYSINNSPFQIYESSFIIKGEGLYSLRYYSVDLAGNNEEIKSKDLMIGKIDKYLRRLQ